VKVFMSYHLPIPPLVEPPNWARLPIVESGEPLVTVADGADNVRVHSLYAALGIPGASAGVRVRAGVYERLKQAAHSLPPGLTLVVFDGYRPLAVQQRLWDDYAAQITARNPHWSPEAVRRAVSEFVAVPTADPACPPPHRTGGAVDVYLVDATGARLPMGTEPDETSPASATRHYEEYPEEPYTGNRRVLFHALTGAGFTNYQGEWWHYDYGNQRWANCAGRDHAIYGLAG
jgi:zinc D-Ala-D-Ala dipeptidase